VLDVANGNDGCDQLSKSRPARSIIHSRALGGGAYSCQTGAPIWYESAILQAQAPRQGLPGGRRYRQKTGSH